MLLKGFLCFVLIFTVCEGAKKIITVNLIENDYPIIGIVAQEISYTLNLKYPGEYNSFIAASYVKFVEGGGARVVPIWINKPKEYYREMMSLVNGILFPGGATYFNQSNGYAEAGRHIYDIAVEMNDNNNYMPLWGTCLGFELLTYLAANGSEHRAHCSSDKQPLPLVFKDDYRTSKMFKNTPNDIVEILETEPVTSNFHQFCVTEKNLTEYHLEDDWQVMSVNDDWNGLTFISTIEHRRYPFYGIQFHPEKNLYEWVRNKNITHTENAVKASQYFAEFFINEARKSFNHFETENDENLYVIYNFPVEFTGQRNSIYEQCYMFKENVNYANAESKEGDASIINYSFITLLICMFLQQLFI